MSHPEAEKVVLSGSFLYDGSVRCPFRIVVTDMRPGTGDHEDDPDLAEDKPGVWFRIDLTAAGDPTRWASSINGFKNLDDARTHVENIMSGVIWSE